MKVPSEPLNERPGGDPRGGEPTLERGRLYVIAAPSGAGKTSLVKALMVREPRLRFSVSYTTRHPRLNEVDGRDYHFVTQARFQEMVERDEFLEHAQVFDNFYGTGLQEVKSALQEGQLLVPACRPPAAFSFCRLLGVLSKSGSRHAAPTQQR
jgi:hypothetical protein